MYNYSLRFSLVPSVDFEERVSALLDFCKKAKIDEVMFFIAPKELGCGHITIEEAKPWVDTIKKAKKILKEYGITTTLNPWITLGHYDLGVKLKKGQNFRAMVGHDGAVADVAPCPLCENWRKYYVDLMNFYVEHLQPDVLWIEDDMRMGNHMPVAHGCFCEEHMRIFNQRLNSNYDRDTLVEKIGTDKAVRKVYLDVMRETVQDTVDYIVRNVKNQSAFGLMTGGTCIYEGRRLHELFESLAIYGVKPLNRCCLNSYRQRGLQEYAWLFNKSSMEVKALTGNTADCVSEIENVPHSMYSKSANFFKYQMLTSASMLFTGATFSMFEFCGNGANNYDRYANMLAEIKPYLSAINDLKLSYDNAVGVHVLISYNSPYVVKNGANGLASVGTTDSWIYAYLEQLGIACVYSTDYKVKGKVVGVSGQVLRNYEDEDIINLFENNFVILTAENVLVLKDRGLSHLIDMKDCEYFEQRISGKYSMEEINSDDKIFGVSQFRATGQMFCGNYLHVDYGKDNKNVYSIVKDHKEVYAGDAITRVNNALVIPYKDNDTEMEIYFPVGMLCPLREYVIKKALLNDCPFNDDLYFVSEENVSPYVYVKDGKTYIIVSNFVDDDYPVIHLKTKKNFDKISIIKVGAEEFVPAKYNVVDGEYVIEECLKAQTSYMLVCE